MTNQSLQESQQGEFPGGEGYNRDEEVMTIFSSDEQWESESAMMETEGFQLKMEQQE